MMDQMNKYIYYVTHHYLELLFFSYLSVLKVDCIQCCQNYGIFLLP